MTDIDIADIWRGRRADAPRVGAHLDSAGTTISVTQECQVALPMGDRFPEVSVTITSNRPGVAAQVSVYANLNCRDFNYQGPTTKVGEGQFTATSSEVHVGFILLPSGLSVLGAGSVAVWADGAENSLNLRYDEIACNPLVWWRWLSQSASHLGNSIALGIRGNR
jgi:hypothetical protein